MTPDELGSLVGLAISLGGFIAAVIIWLIDRTR